MNAVDPTSRTGPSRPRRGRGLANLGLVALMAGCGWLGTSYVPAQVTVIVADVVERVTGRSAESLLPVAGSERVPASERDTPAPSSEEAAAPLGTPPPPPTSAGAHAFTATGSLADGTTFPVRWSPCRPIHYVVDITGAPEGFGAQVDASVTRVSAASGLRFVDDGDVTEAAAADRRPFQPEVYGDRWAPVLIRFTDSVVVGALGDEVAGVAIPTHVSEAISGQMHIVSGAVYLDYAVLSEPDVAGIDRYIPVLDHELGHLVGLGHVDDPSQLMYPELTEVTSFQPGDLAGLSTAGGGACAPQW